jgi:hypothetical protein
MLLYLEVWLAGPLVEFIKKKDCETICPYWDESSQYLCFLDDC